VSSTPGEDATQILARVSEGDAEAAERLMPLVYAELRALAGSYFRGQRPDHTLQPTALVHEAFVRLVNQTNVLWKDRAHFFAIAATAMRQILTDHARRTKAEKRGGNRERISLDRALTPPNQSEYDLVALDDVLSKLGALDPRKHRIVELRFFGGFSVDDVAQVLDVSKTTVESDWRAARAWLSYELSKGNGP
jgi:RNA polymerase sigma factor (TIGR02999 family)